MKKLLLTLTLGLSGLSWLQAQLSTTTASQSVSFMLNNTARLSVSSFTVTNSLLNNKIIGASTFHVTSNRPWAVSINTAFLGVRLNGVKGSGYLSAAPTAITVVGKDNGSFSIDYRMLPGFINRAGAYNVFVVYTQQ